MTWFFAANAGGFVFAHLFFLCVLFFKDWPGTVQGPASFIAEYFGHAGMWSVLLLTFLSGLASLVTATPRPMILDDARPPMASAAVGCRCIQKDEGE